MNYEEFPRPRAHAHDTIPAPAPMQGRMVLPLTGETSLAVVAEALTHTFDENECFASDLTALVGGLRADGSYAISTSCEGRDPYHYRVIYEWFDRAIDRLSDVGFPNAYWDVGYGRVCFDLNGAWR